MNPLSFVPSWVWAAAVAALAATSCKLKIDLGSVQLELEKTKVVYEQERAHQATVLSQAQQRARQTEQGLIEAVVKVREETHEQVTAAATIADDLRRRLRIASANAATAALVSRTTSTATIEQAGAGGDNTLVPAAIGEQDVDEAQRADLIRVELLGCYRQYDAARAALEAVAR